VKHADNNVDSGAFHAPDKPGVSPLPANKTTGKMPVPSGPRIAPFRSLIPFAEVLAEIHKVGPQSKCVKKKYDELLAKLGPELFILENAPLEEISRTGSSLLSEAISRMRAGRVIRRPGFDGQYGTIRLFTDEELK
jgi:PHP family Zn ribbon phosphoesterase